MGAPTLLAGTALCDCGAVFFAAAEGLCPSCRAGAQSYRDLASVAALAADALRRSTDPESPVHAESLAALRQRVGRIGALLINAAGNPPAADLED